MQPLLLANALPNHPFWVWAVTIVAMIIILGIDLAIVDHPWRKDDTPKEFSMKQAGWWATFYIGIAIIFGFGLWYFEGSTKAGEYFAGYITEKSLSIDNLFVFYLILSKFKVPKEYQHEVLLIGIVIALVLRGVFIAIGAAAINQWSEVFYLFGAFLILTAIKIVYDHVRSDNYEKDHAESIASRIVRKIWPITPIYYGPRMSVVIDGQRHLTPMFMVILAIGVTDILFAVDSIPAIFGLTKDPYIVFTANAFALLGLRQLYFLLAGLMDKLSLISWGLSLIMLFIGVKMILHALHENGVHVIDISTSASLIFIVGVMVITIIASLLYASAQEKKQQS